MKKLALLIGLFTFLVFTSVSVNAYGLCYQETANQSTSCGGLATGTYSNESIWIALQNTYDEDWGTYSNCVYPEGYPCALIINYTKPIGSLNSSFWMVRDWNNDVYYLANLTIPSSCWDAYSNVLSVKMEEIDAQGTKSLCYNGTGWQVLRDEDSFGTFEEAMWWNISLNININSPQNITYKTLTIPLETSAFGANNWWYSLNNGANTSFSPNTTITGIEGNNNIRIYANDTTGETTSNLIYFNIILPIIDNLGIFGGIALLIMGAGIILFLIEGLFASGMDIKRLVIVIIGAIIFMAMILSLI